MCLSEQTPGVRAANVMKQPGKSKWKHRVRHKSRNYRPLVRSEYVMLWTILVVLCILWLLGVATSYTMGGLIHILLLAALVILVINLVSGRRGTV